jgi:16S rRNA (cytosine967-C5)-methyltransferase
MTTGALRHRGAWTARAAASRAIVEALRGGEFVSEQIREFRNANRLDDREAALAHEIAIGAIRHAITIRRAFSAVARYDDRRVKPVLRAILYSAAYQLIWLDRVPEFAAVDEAVRLSRDAAGARAAGMVNAVLRNMTRAIEARRVPWERGHPAQIRVNWTQACAFRDPVLPAPQPDGASPVYEAAATSERLDRYRVLARRFGPRRAEAAAWASQATPAIVLHRNPLRIDAARFRAMIAELLSIAGHGDEEDVNITDHAAFLPAFVRVGESSVLAEGLAHVQDVTAHAAATAVGAHPGERILDLCAAPGGKSVVLAQQMREHGEILACDVSDERLALVSENATRMKLSIIRTQKLARDADLSAFGRFDAALVDVPCSNSGVIARRPEARFRLAPSTIRSLSSTQARLLRAAAAAVRPGGRLVYSTCSIEAAENEDIISEFARKSPDWRLEEAELTLPGWGSSSRHWRDGGYFARLVRSVR